MTRRPLISLAAVAAVATMAMTGCVAGEGSAIAPEPTESSAAEGWSSDRLSLDFATYNPLSLIIRDQGWLEAELGDEVEVVWTQSLGSNRANEGLRAGELDLGSTAGSAALLARANGSPIRTVAVYTQPEWAAIVAPDGSDITEVADLRGKTVAVTVGTDPYFFLLQALEEAGVDPSEVSIQNLQHADGAAALANGTVDAWSGLDPIMASAESAGATLVYRNIDFNSYGVLNATEEFVEQSPDLLQLVVDAYERAREWALENPEETAEILAEVGAIDIDIARTVLLERTVIDLDPVPGDVQRDVLTTIGPIQVANGDIASQDAVDAALSELFLPDFAQNADPGRFE